MSKTVAVFSVGAPVPAVRIDGIASRARNARPDFTGVYSPSTRSARRDAAAPRCLRRRQGPAERRRRRDLCWFSMDVRAGRRTRRS